MDKIQKRFKDVRVKNRYTQKAFAKMLGCSRVSLAMYEIGATMPGSAIYARLLELEEKLK